MDKMDNYYVSEGIIKISLYCSLNIPILWRLRVIAMVAKSAESLERDTSLFEC